MLSLEPSSRFYKGRRLSLPIVERRFLTTFHTLIAEFVGLAVTPAALGNALSRQNQDNRNMAGDLLTSQPKADDAEEDDDMRVGMSVQGGTGLTKKGQPVHEMLTLAALINSDYKLDPNTTYQALKAGPTAHLEINDFIRGVIWNDDPECDLYNDDSNNNFIYSTGFNWGLKYKFGGFDMPELIHRSHWGDLQWLHAMSPGNQPPAVTKKSIYLWMETMYKVATGEMPPNTAISATLVKGSFNDPSKYTTIGELLTHGHGCPAVIPHRALGSCFHVIQDSYAGGHTYRELKNPNRPPGEADRWGAVLNFHNYAGEDEDKHTELDHGLHSDNISSIDLRNPDAWNILSGCREGLDKCIQLANFWNGKAEWGDVQKWLDAEVFEISPKATNSNSNIEAQSH